MKKIIHRVLSRIESFEKKHVWLEQTVQFIQFGIVGLSNTLISYTIYAILVHFQTNYLLASSIGFIVSVINSFYWNNKYVFKQRTAEKSKRVLWKKFYRTFLSYAGTGLILHNVLLIFWIQVCGLQEMIAPIINLFITVPLNYVMNKFWAFREKK